MIGMSLSHERTEVVEDAVVFRFRLKNASGAVTRVHGLQFELWQTATFGGGRERRVGELRLDARATVSESHTALKSTLRQSEETPLRLIWVANPDDLQRIEDHRAGTSPEFRICPLLLVEAICPSDAPREQWQTMFGWESPNCGNGWPLLLKITNEDWLALLDRLKFRHNTLDRMKWPVFPPAFSRCEDHLEAAWRNHRTGNFDAALTSCYKAFDCLGFDLTGEKQQRREVLELLMEGAETEKKEKVLQILKSTTDFLHFGRHDGGAPVRVGYEDSQFAVTSTTVALSYLAQYYKLAGRS